MRRLISLIGLIVVLISSAPNLLAQNACLTIGQTPETAFPVCGTATFSQSLVPLCGGNPIIVPNCRPYFIFRGDTIPILYTDKNPFWYKFTCFKAGTLGFKITPDSINQDFDWQLFDVTGHDSTPNDLYKDSSMFVSCNWSGQAMVTGTGDTGKNVCTCGDSTFPVFQPPIGAMPTLIEKHNYLLLVSHFTDSSSGYKLTFEGGTASITDTTPPKLRAAKAPCDGTIIYVKLNKKMKCGSIAPDGSDFSINTTLSNVIRASGVKCDASFDTDSVLLILNNPIPPGKYTINIQNGSDGNTILDNCSNQIPPGDSLPVTIYPQFPTPMDSMNIARCSPTELTLTFSRKMQCSSIASDGSDFLIKGNHPVLVDSAYGNCDEDGFTQSITVHFKTPITLEGKNTIVLIKGGDGNTLINECGKETAELSFLPFTTYDTVSASINQKVSYKCAIATITFSNALNNHKNSWQWQFWDGTSLSGSSQSKSVQLPCAHDTVRLKVSNGICTDSSFQVINLLYDSAKMMTISMAQCKPKQLTVLFNKPIQCKSVAADGSNFTIGGDNPVAIDSAFSNCIGSSGLTNSITLKLKNPITLQGIDTLFLKKTKTGKALLDSCGIESSTGNFLTFTTYDTVSAAFNTKIEYHCSAADITCSNAIDNNKNSWRWRFSDGGTERVPLFTRSVPVSFIKDTIHLTVSNGVCTDSSIQVINLALDSLLMDSLSIVPCSPKQMDITFQSKIKCSSIAADGSNFAIKGTRPVIIDSAFGSCNSSGDISKTVTIRFKNPISLQGTYTISMKKGSNGSILTDECGKVSNPDSRLSFTTYDSVSAAFIPQVSLQCTNAIFTLGNPVNNHKNSWLWQFSDGASYTVDSFTRTIPITNTDITIRLKVSNGDCVDSTFKVVSLSTDVIKAAFTLPEFICPDDALLVQDQSLGRINTYLWEFSDGETSTLPLPPNRTFPLFGQEEKDYTLKLTITNTNNCIDSAIHTTRAMRSCFIGVPSVFTPDSREGHRKLYPQGIFKALNFTFAVYNRFGQQVFISHNYDNQWDGTVNGNPQPTGTYVWMLTYTDALTNLPVFKKGTTVLLR